MLNEDIPPPEKLIGITTLSSSCDFSGTSFDIAIAMKLALR